MSLFQCSKPRAVPWVAMTFLVAWLSPLTGFQVLVGTCPLESWVQMGYIGASSGESTWVWPCLSQTSVFGKLLLVFSNNAPRKLFLFLFSLSHHYTEEISLIESIASISKSGNCIRGGLTNEGQVGMAGVQKAGWPGGSVHGKGKVLLFVYLYCIGATISPFVCICIDLLVYDIFPCEDLFIFFFNVKLNWFG